MTIYERALEMVPNGSYIGLGSGRAAQAFVKALGECVRNGRLFVTDNGNHILDCRIDPIPDANRLELEIRAIPGVVGTGLFLGMANTVLIGDRSGFRLIDGRCRAHQAQVAEHH